jgi:hypothetical protein
MASCRPLDAARASAVVGRAEVVLCQARRAAVLLLAAACTSAGAAPSVALFYGSRPPLDELKAFDVAVVDPGHGSDPIAYGDGPSRLYAYVSVGEAHPTRPWFKDIPADWELGKNRAWGSSVLDLARTQWTDFLVERVFAPLWARGYRGFFLDALDSYRLAADVDATAQQRGLVALIEALHRRFPGIQLILNRGFEVVPQVRDKISMVAAESLYRGWDASSRRYLEVKPADREWLLGQLRDVRDRHGIPVLAIDYVDPSDRLAARAVAERIRGLGIVPWVADAALESLGVGAVEVAPRKVLVLYDSKVAPAVNYSLAHRYLAMPLNHLGYVPVYVDVNGTLPEGVLVGRYAGIVTWFSGHIEAGPRLVEWLTRQVGAGMRAAVLGSFGLALRGSRAQAFGLQDVAVPPRGALRVARRESMFSFEAEPHGDRHKLQPLRLVEGGGRPLLQVGDARGAVFDAAALTAWGGYVLDPFTLAEIPGSDQLRWVVDPFAFLQQSLALPDLPVPDVTTESGRRLLLAHVDADGFPSRAELPGEPFAGRVLLEEILKRYPVPTSVSVTEADTAPDGLRPDQSAELEEIARRAFRLPHVEIASHSYSHPFFWDTVRRGAPGGDLESWRNHQLVVPGYALDLRREILGSVEYLRHRLAPPEKPVQVFQWSGDAAPGLDALAIVAEGRLLNINGGDTIITRRYPSLTAVSGLGIEKGGVLQVYAPIANESRYTNLFHGPYSGYRSVIETLEMTEAPRRLKPIGIYFHFYSATKRASLAALHEVYRWALAQRVHPVFPSEYIRKVQDFHTLVVARTPDGWLVRGRGDLRTLRVPASLGAPDLLASSGVVGAVRGGEGSYLHLASGEALLRLSAAPPEMAHLVEANGRVEAASISGDRLSLRLRGHVPLELSLGGAEGCQVVSDGRPVEGRRAAGRLLQLKLDVASASLEVLCRGR